MATTTTKMDPSGDGLQKDTAAMGAGEDLFYIHATPCQVRFWWVDQLHKNNSSLNMPLAWKISGPFDVERMRTAFAELIERHETLRTTFEFTDDALNQVIHPAMPLSFPFVDISHLAAGEQDRELERWIHEEASIPLNMTSGPLLALRVLRLAPEVHVILVTLHRAIADGWSNGILLRDFAAAYEGLEKNAPADLPVLPLQFADYAHWLDEWRKGPAFQESINYWRNKLGGNFTTLQLPYDFADDGKHHEGRIESLLVSPGLAERARQFCQSRDLTTHMLYLSVFALMINRVTGQADVVIGTPAANRRPGTEDLVGPFSNPLTARFDLAGDRTLAQILDGERTAALDAMKHQDVPFEDIYQDEFFSRRGNQIPLQLYFIFQKAFMLPQQTQSLNIRPLRSVSPGAAFDLSLSVVERAEGPRLQLEFDTGRFRAETIQRMLSLFIEILDRAVSQPDAMVASLPQSAHQPVVPTQTGDDAATGKGLNVGQGIGAPRDALELQVARIWESALGIQPIRISDNFFDIGGRSLAALQIISRINRAFGVDFGLATLLSGSTVEGMARLIHDHLPVNTAATVIPMQTKAEGRPLYILHGVGGNIVRFYQMATLLGKEHPIYAVQSQALLSGQPALLRMEDQAACYIKEIRAIQPKGPYSFLGYSFGGILAIEMAHQLKDAGEEVDFIGMLDSLKPGVVTIVRNDTVRTWFERRIEQFLRNFTPLTMAEKVQFFREKTVKWMRRTAYTILMRVGARSAPAWMKDARDLNTITQRFYQTRGWPGRIVLFRAEEQFMEGLPEDLGWSELIKHGVEIVKLPGDHNAIFGEPIVRELAARVLETMESRPVAGEL